MPAKYFSLSILQISPALDRVIQDKNLAACTDLKTILCKITLDTKKKCGEEKTPNLTTPRYNCKLFGQCVHTHFSCMSTLVMLHKN